MPRRSPRRYSTRRAPLPTSAPDGASLLLITCGLRTVDGAGSAGDHRRRDLSCGCLALPDLVEGSAMNLRWWHKKPASAHERTAKHFEFFAVSDGRARRPCEVATRTTRPFAPPNSLAARRAELPELGRQPKKTSASV